jgi:spore maturation protein B
METFVNIISTISILAIPALILFIVIYGAIKKVKIYEAFVEGAKEGFNVGVRIIPYLVAMLVAIGIFRAGGAMELLSTALSPFTKLIGMPAEALPMALMRPLSGSGALGVMSEIMKAHGPDSIIGRMVSVMMGSGETTFYVLAVYFGSISITKTRQAVPAGIVADVVGIVMSVWLVNLIWG